MGRLLILLFFLIGFIIYSTVRYIAKGLNLGKSLVNLKHDGFNREEISKAELIITIINIQVNKLIAEDKNYDFSSDKLSLYYFFNIFYYFFGTGSTTDNERTQLMFLIILNHLINDKEKFNQAIKFFPVKNNNEKEFEKAIEASTIDILILNNKGVNKESLEKLTGLIKLRSKGS